MATRLLTFFVLATVLSFSLATAIWAADGDSVAGCPDSFELHPAMEHDEHHGHQHVGSDTDFNGDGYICAKHVGQGGNIHVHIDNHFPAP